MKLAAGSPLVFRDPVVWDIGITGREGRKDHQIQLARSNWSYCPVLQIFNLIFSDNSPPRPSKATGDISTLRYASTRKRFTRGRVAPATTMTSSVHSDEAAAIPVVRANLVKDVVISAADR